MRNVKKTWAGILALVMLMTLAALPASAAYVTDEATFTPVGRIEMVWDVDASDRLDVSDGDMSDWANAGYEFYHILPENMVSWVGGSDTELDPGMPDNWSISTYFVADAEYLYVGFYTVDDRFVYASNGDIYDGDAFQLSVDFGGLLGKLMEEDPLLMQNQANIFYSFACVDDGAPLTIVRQNSDHDGIVPMDEATGAAMKTPDGWSAEFCISWQQLFDDFAWKAWAEDAVFYFGPESEFYINCALYYLSRDDENRTVTWAACTGNGELTWTPADSGIRLTLPYAEGRELICTGITNIKPEETEAPETQETTEPETTEAPTTPAETEAPTTPVDTETEAVETTAAASTDNSKGCGSAIGFGAASIMMAAAAAVALKKK